jgi:uncharacterized protein (TIGR02217 family)
MLILDDNLALGFTAGPTYSTSIIPLSGGRERRNKTWALPRRAYQFSYNNRLIEDCWELEDFFHDVDGQAQTWLMPDFTLPIGRVVSLGTGTGALTQFQARIGYGNSVLRYVDVTAIRAGTLAVFVNAVPVTVATEVNGLITLSAAPTIGTAVTATFRSYVKVRFEQDDLQIKVDGPEGRFGVGTPLSAVEVR